MPIVAERVSGRLGQLRDSVRQRVSLGLKTRRVMQPPLLTYLNAGGRAWRFSRLIIDRLTDSTSRVEGTSRWTLSPSSPLSLAQNEEGELALNAALSSALPVARAPLPVRAAYAWAWSAPDSRAAAVAFSDGRPFLAAVNFLDVDCRVRHECEPDLYEGVFARSPDGFVVTWVVVGPSKNYTSTTRFLHPLGVHAEEKAGALTVVCCDS